MEDNLLQEPTYAPKAVWAELKKFAGRLLRDSCRVRVLSLYLHCFLACTSSSAKPLHLHWLAGSYPSNQRLASGLVQNGTERNAWNQILYKSRGFHVFSLPEYLPMFTSVCFLADLQYLFKPNRMPYPLK